MMTCGCDDDDDDDANAVCRSLGDDDCEGDNERTVDWRKE